MSYREMLDEAIGDSPISTVDVDRVIERQRRAGKLRRWGVCGAAAAAVLAVVVTAAQVLPSNTSPQPAGEQRITTVAGTPEDQARLDNAVFAALRREAPSLRWPNSSAPDTPDWSHAGTDENTVTTYFGQATISVDGVEAHLMVQVDRRGADYRSGLRCADTAETTCRRTAGPNGGQLETTTAGRREKSEGGQDQFTQVRSISLLRSDDAVVTVILQRFRAPDERMPMTEEKQTAIALDPAIVLAPLPPGVVVTPPAPGPSEPSVPPSEPASTGTSGPLDPAEQRRIDNAIFASLRQRAPGVAGEGLPGAPPTDLAAAWSDSGGENTADSYWGQGRIVVDGLAGLFSVAIYRENPGIVNLECGKNTKTYSCAGGTGPNGERYRIVTNGSSGGSAERTIDVVRKDGACLIVDLAGGPQEEFVLTADQQRAIAFDQTIALAER